MNLPVMDYITSIVTLKDPQELRLYVPVLGTDIDNKIWDTEIFICILTDSTDDRYQFSSFNLQRTNFGEWRLKIHKENSSLLVPSPKIASLEEVIRSMFIQPMITQGDLRIRVIITSVTETKSSL